MTACELNTKVDLYAKEAIINDLGEDDFKYIKLKSLWVQIIPTSGNTKTIAGKTEYSETSHKFIARLGAVKNLSEDMYFVFKTQRYDIKYFMPNYKTKDRIEIFCVLKKSGEVNG